MTKTVLSWVRFVPTTPWALITWFLGVLACLVQLAEFKKLRFSGVGILSTTWRPWFAKIYPFTLTLGRLRVNSPSIEFEKWAADHEDVHVAQVEDLMFLSLLLGIFLGLNTGDYLLGFALWTSGGVWQLPNYPMAILRYGHTLTWAKEGSFGSKFKKLMSDLFVKIAYAEAQHERSAYAQTDPVGPNGESWSSLRESR